jgi:hypothetical protein
LLGQFMQKSVWAFAVVETVHLIALAALGGSLILVHLGMLGILRRITVRKLASGLFPIVFGGLIVMIVTGILMVSEEALKCFYSPAFPIKMLALGVTVVIYFPLFAAQTRINVDPGPWWQKVAATLSLLSWLTVGLAGRAIAFCSRHRMTPHHEGIQIVPLAVGRPAQVRPLAPCLLLVSWSGSHSGRGQT